MAIISNSLRYTKKKGGKLSLLTRLTVSSYFNESMEENWVLDDGHEMVDFPEGNQYIVPIFELPQFNMHKGCGIFVGSYLITVGHVALKDNNSPLPQVYVYYMDSFIQLNDENIIYDGRGNPDKDGVHDDLLIYQVSGVDSPFTLNEQNINTDQILYTEPYDYIEEKNDVRKSGNECRIISLHGKVLNGDGVWSNCFSVNNPCVFHSGNSGSALFRRNVVYGLLIGGDATGNNGRWYTVLDSRYIKSIIDNHTS